MSEGLYTLIRNALFCLPPEASHNAALKAMALSERLGLAGLLAGGDPRLAQPVQLLGLEFPHRVGLAAGLDKNADYVDALTAQGFAFIEVGTLTPRPQPGNPKPRLFRLRPEQAIINRMGFNNKGIEHALTQLARRHRPGIVGINIGKNFDTPVERAVDDYLICLRRCYASADYVTVNISSPNTPGLRSLQFGAEFNQLLHALKQEQALLDTRHGRYVPLLVKLAPDLAEDEIRVCCESLLHQGIDGVIATNTTLDRTRIGGSPFAAEAGGLSGAPLTAASTAVIAAIKSHVGDRLPIIGVGGIMSGADARAKLEAGADLLQLYSGFIYRGPALIDEILRAIVHD
jgi:dihydroorotate dehydrogenase